MSTTAFRDRLLTGQLGGLTYERENQTEAYVEIPPALLITDQTGAVWGFGTHWAERNGWYEFNVVRNDIDTDEYAVKIVYKGRRVWLYGRDGWRVWTGRSFL